MAKDLIAGKTIFQEFTLPNGTAVVLERVVDEKDNDLQNTIRHSIPEGMSAQEVIRQLESALVTRQNEIWFSTLKNMTEGISRSKE